MRDDEWLPPGKDCAVAFSIDDTHPATFKDGFEAGGDLGEGQLGHLEWLMGRHGALKVTLFVTANWRETSAVPTRRILARIPYLKDRAYLAKRWPKDKMRLDRHPEFIAYLNGLSRTELAYHGLYHCHKGPRIPVEFQEQTKGKILRDVGEMTRIFDRAGMNYVKGMSPPGWNAPQALMDALAELGFDYIASARDLDTPVSCDAKTNMSGLKGVHLIYPQMMKGDLVHFPTNFQVTSHIERAREILELNGLLNIKAHVRKLAYGRMNIDGLDMAYANYLDLLLTRIEEDYGSRIWWTSMGEIAKRMKSR